MKSRTRPTAMSDRSASARGRSCTYGAGPIVARPSAYVPRAGVGCQRLALVVRLLRPRELDELDLVELMLTEDAAHVLAVRTGLAAKAGRVRRVAQRELAAVEDLAAMQSRERHFCRRHQIQVPLAGDLEQVGRELRQVSGARQRRGVGHERGLDFVIPVLAGVEDEHEV